jgi:replicative DNA helicase
MIKGEIKIDIDGIMSAKSIDIIKYTTRMAGKGTLKFPVNRVNEYCNSVCLGYTIAIIGTPSSGKTSIALNIAFFNSVLNNKNTLYLYLEDMPERYQYNIFSRYSYYTGDKIGANALKRGISVSDHKTIKKIQEVQEMFLKDNKGEIIISVWRSYQQSRIFSQENLPR